MVIKPVMIIKIVMKKTAITTNRTITMKIKMTMGKAIMMRTQTTMSKVIMTKVQMIMSKTIMVKIKMIMKNNKISWKAKPSSFTGYSLHNSIKKANQQSI